MSNSGTVDAGRQAQSPASAGSRGLAKTTQFTKDPTQMKMGNSPIAESMVEIRNILNRIDGVNVPVKEDNMRDLAIHDIEAQLGKINDEITFLQIDQKDKESALAALGELRSVLDKYQSQQESAVNELADDDKIEFTKVMLDISQIKDRVEALSVDEEAKKSAIQSLTNAEEALVALDETEYEPFPEEDEMTFEDDDAFYEAFGELGFPEDETELFDAEYRGRKVPLNKPMRGDVKKFKVYVKDPKTGNVKKVNFGHGGSSARKAGQKTMKIRKSNPKARKSFRARHNCANPGPKTKARYWSCRKW
jgi:hypothetical protein